MVEPVLTIGMPVFNGAKTLPRVLASLMSQSFTDFELVISDNCSNDSTRSICEAYAKKDHRIRYFRHSENIGPAANFKYVLNQANGKYFTWAASDDVRTSNFLKLNVEFLQENPDFVASTSPNFFDGEEGIQSENTVRFSLAGNLDERLIEFLSNSWQSHAIFYSVMRSDIIKSCDILGSDFLAFDWAINVFLLKNGKINRTQSGALILGAKGYSNGPNKWKTHHRGIINWFFPLYTFSEYVWKVTGGKSIAFRLNILGMLLRLNYQAARGKARDYCYEILKK